jgi:hypothetical protein
MDIAALVAWVLTAGGGFVMVARWVSAGGLRQQQDGPTRFPAPLVFGHAGLAAAGLVVWIAYLALDADPLPWVAVGLLVVVALLGFTLFARWLPSRRAVAAHAGASGVGTASTGADPAERHLPVPVVAAHGVFAVATLVLVVLAAVQAGS